MIILYIILYLTLGAHIASDSMINGKGHKTKRILILFFYPIFYGIVIWDSFYKNYKQ